MSKSRYSLVGEKTEVKHYRLSDIVRFLECSNLPKCQKFKFEIQECDSPCLKKVCLYNDVERLIIAQSSREQENIKLETVEMPDILKSIDHSDEEDDLELTGQPLEYNFGLFQPSQYGTENTKIPSTKRDVIPVKLQDARQLLGIYNCVLAEKGPLLLENVLLIVLCDCQDSLKTAFLGSCLQDKTITTIDASIFGPMPAKNLPSFSSVKEKHSQICANTLLPTEREVFCQYNILDNDEQEDFESSSLVVECRWKNATSLLESPSANAICKLFAKVVPGEERSPAFAIYKELLLLKRLLQGLKTGEVVWSAEPSEIGVIDKVKNLISGVKDGGQWRKTDAQQNSTVIDTLNFDSFLEAIVMGKRQNVEFTDHLWTALTGCTSYVELKESLEMIVKAVQNRTIQPLVLHTNKTTLGNWIKRMVNEDAAEISLESVEPLKLLLEMGIEKLKKDYSVVFVGFGLTTEESLQPFLVNNSSLEERTDLLHKLHCTLELIVMCKTYLQLSSEILGGFARQAVKFYSSVDRVLPSHKFQFPIQLLAVRKAINILQPLQWEICFKTSTENYVVFTFCQLTVQPPFDHLKDLNSCSKKEEYFCTTVNCVQDSSLF